MNTLVEFILENYNPKLGLKYGYAKPIGKSNLRDDQKDLFVWEIEKLYELDELELKSLISKLEED